VSEGLQITLASGDAASQLLRLGAALEQEARGALGDHAFSLAHELGRPSGGVLVAWLADVPIGLLSFLREPMFRSACSAFCASPTNCTC
jgi:hypothetical protein